MTLKQARERRDTAKGLLANNIDPSAQRRIDKYLADGNTFRSLAGELLDKLEREGLAQITLVKKRWLLSFAYPLIGDRPVDKITAPELLSVLRQIESRGRYETARQLRSTCGMVFDMPFSRDHPRLATDQRRRPMVVSVCAEHNATNFGKYAQCRVAAAWLWLRPNDYSRLSGDGIDSSE